MSIKHINKDTYAAVTHRHLETINLVVCIVYIHSTCFVHVYCICIHIYMYVRWVLSSKFKRKYRTEQYNTNVHINMHCKIRSLNLFTIHSNWRNVQLCNLHLIMQSVVVAIYQHLDFFWHSMFVAIYPSIHPSSSLILLPCAMLVRVCRLYFCFCAISGIVLELEAYITVIAALRYRKKAEQSETQPTERMMSANFYSDWQLDDDDGVCFMLLLLLLALQQNPTKQKVNEQSTQWTVVKNYLR